MSITYDRKERAVVWKMSAHDAALLGEWIGLEASPRDGLQDEAKALREAAYEGLVHP